MKKYKIGYTSGVYDMFHIGHLNVLRNAKAQCDHLVVGVSTDELVADYKHKKPVIHYEERAQIVAAIRYVDQIVPQTNMDKLSAAQKVNANAVFVGDDWKGTAKWNEIERILAAHGIDVVYLPHTDGISSTLLTDIKEQKVDE
jgi:glycerol-3-phosphate cytidylyltransferase